MAGLNPFKVPKHQRYRYIPRYWEPDKEDLKERIRQASSASSDDPVDMKARISRGFQRRASYRGASGNQAKRKSNLILLALIVGLLYISYVLIVKYLPQIENALQ
jgi:hypothetical protein